MRGSAVFDSAGLESNRAGRLSDTQLPWLRKVRQRSRIFSTVMAVAGLFVGVSLLVSSGDPGPLQTIVGLSLGLIGLGYLARAAGVDALSRDIRSRTVAAAEGELSAQKVHVVNPMPEDAFFLAVGDRRFRATQDQFNAAPNTERVRLYYLARSNRAVNWESLPDARPKQPSRG